MKIQMLDCFICTHDVRRTMWTKCRSSGGHVVAVAKWRWHRLAIHHLSCWWNATMERQSKTSCFSRQFKEVILLLNPRWNMQGIRGLVCLWVKIQLLMIKCLVRNIRLITQSKQEKYDHSFTSSIQCSRVWYWHISTQSVESLCSISQKCIHNWAHIWFPSDCFFCPFSFVVSDWKRPQKLILNYIWNYTKWKHYVK